MSLIGIKGMTVVDASKHLSDLGYEVLVKQPLPTVLTNDHNPLRITIQAANGIVTGWTVG